MDSDNAARIIIGCCDVREDIVKSSCRCESCGVRY